MRFFLLLSMALSLLPNTFAVILSKELQDELSKTNGKRKIPIILTFHEDTSNILNDANKNKAKFISRRRLRTIKNRNKLRKILKRNDLEKVKDLWLTNSLSLSVTPEEIETLTKSKLVKKIKLDIKLQSPAYISQSALPEEWNLDAINIKPVWDNGFQGQNVVVAIMDTGVDGLHPDLADKYRGGDNSWFDPAGQYLTPDDTDGHGTHVAGIILGGNQSGINIGVAPQAKWIGVKLFDDSGNASFSNIHLAFQWLIDPDNDPNTDDYPDIVNNSWGLREYVNKWFDEFYDDIQVLRSLGILVVFSAGNEGPFRSTSISPANYDLSLAVGATDINNIILYSSSRGPSPCHDDYFPQLVAPGQNIYTCDITYAGSFPNSYTTVSYGTSFSAPHISGALAVLLSAFSGNNTNYIKAVLKKTAIDHGAAGPDHDYGYGLANIRGAYDYLNDMVADIDEDHDVDLADLSIFLEQWLKPDCTDLNPCCSDFNNDNNVNAKDFNYISKQYKKDQNSFQN